MPQPSQHISHFLIGIPASGKSTLALWLQSQTQGQIISTDAIRQKLYGDANIQGKWPEIAHCVDEAIQRAIAIEQTIIYDATNFHRGWRQDFLARYSYLTWVAWQLHTPFRECWERNQLRSRQVPFEIMRQMLERLEAEPPQCVEGFEEIIAVQNSNHKCFKALKKLHPQYLGD
ncbi:putative kinase [[Leptolyngbya] sp. PCC 7376]|uniref:ATP-binding protein n=1 Tax=[Leptolyngbya] sp. PCC 7376 TaxID=111781 RepID=UPI00029F337D|nr:ATP-binding protein [[Leptolyngbya] sp. PCC 7376]AFY36944.1 putative kinase [[Leptolyngbya] sp. PCC 7376]